MPPKRRVRDPLLRTGDLPTAVDRFRARRRAPRRRSPTPTRSARSSRRARRAPAAARTAHAARRSRTGGSAACTRTCARRRSRRRRRRRATAPRARGCTRGSLAPAPPYVPRARTRPSVRARQATRAAPRKPMRAIPLGGVRLDLGVREVAGERLDLALLRRELEVHGGHTSGVRLARSSWPRLRCPACGGHGSALARERRAGWSAALDRNDNEAAARLFADDAQSRAGRRARCCATMPTPCSGTRPCPAAGTITSSRRTSETDVLVVFRARRSARGHRCDGPGARAAALFRVRDGQIVLWHQTTVPPADEGSTIV